MPYRRTPQDDGPPVTVVVYPTPDGGRISTSSKHGAIRCGRLGTYVTPDDDPETTKRDVDGRISSLCHEFFGIGVALRWEPGDEPGWWTGTVVRLDGAPL